MVQETCCSPHDTIQEHATSRKVSVLKTIGDQVLSLQSADSWISLAQDGQANQDFFVVMGVRCYELKPVDAILKGSRFG